MSDEQVQTMEEVVNVFYPDDNAEPLEAPTAETATDELPEEAKEESAEVDDTKAEAEELESESADKGEDKSDTVDVYEINGKEYTAEQIEALESGSMMQADYTKKTQEHAEAVKVFNDEKTLFESDKLKVSDLSAQLEVLVAEDAEINWLELKEDDPEAYIEQKEKADKRKAKLEEVKAEQAKQPTASVLTQDQLAAEGKDFHNYDPAWVKDGQFTETYKTDMKVAGEYLQEKGYSQDEVNAISYSHHWQTIIDASKYNAQKNKVTSIKKKVLKTPKATKPAVKSNSKSAEEIFYGK